jgi:hypothetical protein
MDPTRTDAGNSPSRTSQRLDPEVAESARQSVTPDPDLYDRPSTNRISPANIGLSIGALVLGIILVVVMLMFLR